MNHATYAAGEHDRILGNVVMVGVIAQLDVAAARVTVNVDGLTTDWLPWVAMRAGDDATWSAPEAGDQVLLVCPYGDPAQGVVVGSIYQDAHPAPSTTADESRVKFKDGTTITYNRATHAYTIDVSPAAGSVVVNCKTATVTASESVTLDTPDTFCKGKLTVDGLLTAKASANVTGTVTASTDCIGGGKSLKNHTHGGVQAGGSQTAPPT